jgi:prolyl oligopeptidase
MRVTRTSSPVYVSSPAVSAPVSAPVAAPESQPELHAERKRDLSGSTSIVPATAALSAMAPAGLAASVSATLLGAWNALHYPAARRGRHVDVVGGEKVADPYRWMESATAERQSYIDAQNALTRKVIDAIPARSVIAERVRQLMLAGAEGTHRTVNGNTFFTKREGGREQTSLYAQRPGDAAPHLVVDPGILESDATMDLRGWHVSPDGRYIAYGLSDNGSDWVAWRIHEVATARDLPDVVSLTKDQSIAWSKDSIGFYYASLPKPEKGAELTELVHDQTVRYHVLGRSDDAVVYDPGAANVFASPSVFGDKLFLSVSPNDTGVETLLWRTGSASGAPFEEVLPGVGSTLRVLDQDGDKVFVFNSAEGGRGKVLEVDLSVPQSQRKARELLPEDPEAVLQDISVIGRLVYATYLRNATSELRILRMDGTLKRTIPLPDRGTVSGFSGDDAGNKVEYTLTNYYTPPTTYTYDASTNETKVKRTTNDRIDTGAFQTEQIFFRSKDGTRVPMFVTRRKDVPRDGKAPVLLYGYGGFDNALTPSYSARMRVWLEMGGIVAVPSLRGGGEFGAHWHEAGTKAQKQNVYDDFIGAADCLVEQGYTTHKKIVMSGGSNGGLLVSAVVTQRPDICGAALPNVGVHDIYRHHLFTWGWSWEPDYGTSAKLPDYRAQKGYAPLIAAAKPRAYPPVLIETSDHDDRVVPMHSYKLAAHMQRNQKADVPVLLKVNHNAGHGAGAPVRKTISDIADAFAFALRAIDCESHAERLKSLV